MISKSDIPRKVLYRLSLYQRRLQRLRDNGIETVASAALPKAAIWLGAGSLLPEAHRAGRNRKVVYLAAAAGLGLAFTAASLG